jgi:glutamate-1-semialdehyde 2,1-aminomutase/spore coat polysaccharide biosynthesis protein SpsF
MSEMVRGPEDVRVKPQTVIAIIQARMGSSRLPGKVLLEIGGHPILWHVVRRLRKARSIDKVVVATTTAPADDAIAEFCSARGVACFRGSEADVLDRYYRAACAFGADVVVRITADCPFVDPAIVDRCVGIFWEDNYDYVSNTLTIAYPDGMDVEVFSRSCLDQAWREARLSIEREHVTPYIRTSGKFRLGAFTCDFPLPQLCADLRLTVDEPRDLQFADALLSQLSNSKNNNNEDRCDFDLQQIVHVLEREPHLMSINQGIICNEGYYKSLAEEPAVPERVRSLARSASLKAKAEKLIPSCTQTFSKAPTQFVQGVAPVFLERAQGSHVWDVDDNEYIDFAMALGPIILGHNYPRVTDAVCRQAQIATSLSLPHRLEVEVAEQLTELIPCAEMVRFGKNGSDATSGAVRAARAYTGRDIIAACGYHGWQDWYIGTTTRNAGVPVAVRQLTRTFEYNNLASLEIVFAEHPGQVAAVIMEPVGVVEPSHGYLQQVRDLTHKEGALLIFDEVVTGFRLALGGAQEYLGVVPDLGCFGKAMANGYPIAAVVGPSEFMKIFDEIFFSFTFGGELVSLAAAAATIAEMREKDVIRDLFYQGQRLKDGYNVLAKHFGMEQRTECIGLPPRTVVAFKDENGEGSLLMKSVFQQECLKRGVLFTGGHNLCYSHSAADIDYTLRVYRTAMAIVAEAVRHGKLENILEGEAVQPVFRRA